MDTTGLHGPFRYHYTRRGAYQYWQRQDGSVVLDEEDKARREADWNQRVLEGYRQSSHSTTQEEWDVKVSNRARREARQEPCALSPDDLPLDDVEVKATSPPARGSDTRPARPNPALLALC